MNPLILASFLSVGNLPTWTHPDTEVTTNVVCRFDNPSASDFRLRLDTTPTPTNAVCVAFGTDDDEDGVLGLDETCFTAGWDCGVWFVRGAVPNDLTTEDLPADDPGESRRLITWRLHRRALDWNLLRVTVRGVDTPAVRLVTGTHAEGLLIRIK